MSTRSKTRALSLLVLIMFLLVPIAGAVSSTDPAPKKCTNGDELFKKLSADAELYNKKFDKVPAIIKTLVDSHSALVKIKLDDGKILRIAVTTNDGKIETFSKYNPKSKFNPSITVVTDEKTVRAVIDSTNPFKEAFKFLEKGCIKINGENCFIKVVFCTLEKYYGC